MRRVWLLRHAKSSWDDPGIPDHDRPLAPRGRKAAKRMALWADENDVRPDLVLCSTALRARATLDLVLPGLGKPATAFDDDLYHASAAGLLERLRALPDDAAAVLLVGHNPGLHDLACLLAPPGPEAFPTAALADLRLAADTWPGVGPGCGRLDELLLPRSLS
jgi:phosphohistidine phosphatase